MTVDRKFILKAALKYVQQKKWTQAIAEYSKLAKDEQVDRSLFNTIGDLHLKNNNKEEAINSYLKAAQSYQEEGFIPQAIAIFKKIIRIDEYQYEVYSKLAQLYTKQGLNHEAIENYGHLAEVYTEQKDPVKVLNLYEKMAKLDPENTQLLLELANLYLQQGKKADAVQEYIKVGQYFLEKKVVDEAVEVFEEASQLDSNNRVIKKGLAQAYIIQGKADLAAELLRQMLEATSDEVELLRLYGKCLEECRDYKGAEKAYRRAIAVESTDLESQTLLVKILIRQDHYSESLPMLLEAAKYLRKRGQQAEAEKLLQQVKDSLPNETAPLTVMIDYYQTSADPDQAKDLYLQVIRINLKNGRNQAAEALYWRALQAFPEDPELKSRLEAILGTVSKSTLEAEMITSEGYLQTKITRSAAAEPNLFVGEKDLAIEPDLAPQMDQELEELLEPASVNLPESAVDETYAKEIAKADQELKLEEEETIATAKTYLSFGMQENAREVLERILQKDPDNTEAASLMAELLSKVHLDKDLAPELQVEEMELASGKPEIEIEAELAPSEIEFEPIPALTGGLIEDELAEELEAEKESEQQLEKFPDLEKIFEAEKVSAEVSATPSPEPPQDVESILSIFKETIKHQVPDEDAKTHYELGIAFLEMELVQDALNEFLISVKNSAFKVRSLDMAAKCYARLGDLEKAQESIKEALSIPDLKEQIAQGLRYELAILLEESGDLEKVQTVLQDILEKDPNYRDCQQRLQRIQKQISGS